MKLAGSSFCYKAKDKSFDEVKLETDLSVKKFSKCR